MKHSIRTLMVVLAASLGACGDRSVSTPLDTAGYTTEAWVTGSHIKGANGLYFSPQGQLHVASVVTSMILLMDHESGAITGKLDASVGVANPDDLAINDDGLLCWTGIVPGTVGCIPAEGEPYKVAQFTPGKSGPNPITFSDDGRLFVGECFFGFELYEVDPTGKGVDSPRLITRDRKLGPSGPYERCGFNGMDWGPDGKLYGPRWFDREVAVMDVDSGEFDTWVDGLVAPSAVKFDAQNRLHVLDSGAGKLYRVEDDRSKTLLADLTPGMDNLAFNQEGRLWVSSYADGYVAEVLLDKPPGDNLRMISPAGLSMAGGAMLSLRSGDPELLISDYYSLRYYNLDTGVQTHVVRDIVDFADGLGTVLSVSPGAEGLLLTSWIDSQIKLWDEQNDQLLLDLRPMGAPIDAVMFNGEILYSDAATQSVYSVPAEQSDNPDKTERYKSKLLPAGLALGDDNAVYLTEFAELGRLLKLAEGGKWLDSPKVIATALWNPEGVAIAGDYAYVVETGAQRLTRITLATGEKTIIGRDLGVGIPAQPGMPPTMLFSGVTVDAAGVLYVPGDVSNTIYRFHPPQGEQDASATGSP